MRVFVFEFITGGGWYAIDPKCQPEGSLLREGAAMAEAVIADFDSIADVEVTSLLDARLARNSNRSSSQTMVGSAEEVWNLIATHSAAADFTLLIAPEFDGYLLKAAEIVEELGGNLLSPSPPFIRIAADKVATSKRLAATGIAVPSGCLIRQDREISDDLVYPIVMKPVDGAGSLDVQLLPNRDELSSQLPFDGPRWLEGYCEGLSASVSAIGAGGTWVCLPPCLQQLSADGCFTYLGGSCPIEPVLAARATRLAEAALTALPPTQGYVGIDMVLGNDASGANDRVIEVNPRLTTSYVGLRKLVRDNLASAMMGLANGESVTLSTRPGRVEFSAGGELQYFSE